MAENEKKNAVDTANLAKRASAAAVGLAGSTMAMAEGAVMDTSAIVSDINATKPEMINVGTAMIGLIIVAVLFMMIRRVLR